MEEISDEPPLTERERMETDLIRSLISSYFHIVRESIQDLIPKAIMHLLVNHCKEVSLTTVLILYQVLQTRLVADLYREDMFNELLYEDDNLKQEREKCEKMLTVYKEAARVIAEVM
jgi:dynamin 1-like protein